MSKKRTSEMWAPFSATFHKTSIAITLI